MDNAIRSLSGSLEAQPTPRCPKCGDEKEGFYFSAIGSIGCVVRCRKCGSSFDCNYELSDFAQFFIRQRAAATVDEIIASLRDASELLRERHGSTGFDASIALILERAEQMLKSIAPWDDAAERVLKEGNRGE